MRTRTVYITLGIVLLSVIVVFLLLDEPAAVDPTQAEAGLPQGHPQVGAMPGGPDGSEQPSRANVRPEFLKMLEDLRESVAKNPADTAHVLQLARLLSDSHQFKEAVDLYERYLRAAPRNTAVLLDLSICYHGLSQLDDASRITRRILAIEPGNTMAMYNLGAIYAAQGKTEDARSVWQMLVEKFPDSNEAGRAKESLTRI